MTYADTLRPLDEVRLQPPLAAPSAPVRAARGGLAWCRRHPRSLLVVAGLLAVGATAHGWGMYRYPSRTVNDDEGTYVAQAWAVVRRGTLAHYTYWYDHPPLGWLQLAGWAWLTDGFHRVPAGVYGARPRVVPAPAVDRRGREPASFAVAVLTKETTLVLLPGVVWFLWRGSDPRTRRFSLVLFGAVFTSLVAFYPLYALVKGELFEGGGHVSLLWAMRWQVFLRSGNGSLLEAGSPAHRWLTGWLDLDPWLLGAGGCLLPFGLACRRLRPLALLLGIQVLMMMRGGYLPYPFVIGLLPFAALLVAGAGDDLWSRAGRCSGRVSRLLLRAPVHGSLVVAAVLIAPGSARGVSLAATTDADAAMRSAVDWVGGHVARSSRMVVDDSSWTELVGRGFEPSRTIWFSKLDADPAVQSTLGGQGWRAVDYLLDPDSVLLSSPDRTNHPTVVAAWEHSRVIARFHSAGSTPAGHTVEVRQVIK